jgi:hypothetical protein
MWINLFQGWGGQSPVFYNLFVAVAAFVTLHVLLDANANYASVCRRGAMAMLLIGCAIQVKYTAVFEGVALGLIWLYRARGLSQRLPGSVPIAAGVWILCALGPTLAAWGTYIALGYGPEFFHANFLSIFLKSKDVLGEAALQRIVLNVSMSSPLLAMALFASARAASQWPKLSQRERQITIFGVLWLSGAIIGVVAIGNFYIHYMLPLMAPLLFMAARWVKGDRPAIILVLALIGCGAATSSFKFYQERILIDNGGKVREIARLAGAMKRDGCIFVVGAAAPILYHLTQSCIPTRYAFPDHLILATEERALGIEPIAELERVLQSVPTVVVTQKPDPRIVNERAWTFLEHTLEAHYIALQTVMIGTSEVSIFIPRGRARQ